VRYLTEIGQLDLLPRLFETIFIPSIVYEELQHPASPQSVRSVFNKPPAWVKIVATEMADDDPVIMALDEGEKAALTLGVNLGADLILIDERKGAAAAKIKGLEFTGTLGILIRGAQRQWIDLAESFARLRETNFYCSEELLRSLLQRYGKQ
jgi:predicted nucleic acid-binding protein